MKPTESVLRDLYEVKKLSIEAIGAQFGVAYHVARRWMISYKILFRKPGVEKFKERGPGESVLRDLYEVQRLTTRAIAKQFDVKHISVRRWLEFYGIDRRAGGRGLANRGVQGPTKEELFHMLHVEHIGFRGVAEKYGVDYTAVAYWAKNLDIKPPTIWETRSKGTFPKIDPEEVRHLYESGLSLEEIGSRFGVSAMPIKTICERNDIEVRPSGLNQTEYTCSNGLVVRSSYEARVAEWLIAHDLEFAYEPKYPFHNLLRADFLVNGWYVEIWGIDGWESYREKRDRKVRLCRLHGIPLIQFNTSHFASHRKDSFERTISILLTPVKASGMLF